MNIRTLERENNIVLLKLEGVLDYYGTLELKQAVNECIDEASPLEHLVFDVDNVNFIGSCGIGFFLSLMSRLKCANGDLIIVCKKHELLNLFKVTQLTKFIDCHYDVTSLFSELGIKNRTVA